MTTYEKDIGVSYDEAVKDLWEAIERVKRMSNELLDTLDGECFDTPPCPEPPERGTILYELISMRMELDNVDTLLTTLDNDCGNKLGKYKLFGNSGLMEQMEATHCLQTDEEKYWIGDGA